MDKIKLLKDEMDSLFIPIPILGSIWKRITYELIDKPLSKSTSNLEEFKRKLEKIEYEEYLPIVQKIAELRLAYKTQMITIGVLLLSIGVSFFLAGYTLTPTLISISFYNQTIFYIIASIFSVIGIYLYFISYKNFQICESIIERSEILIQIKNNK